MYEDVRGLRTVARKRHPQRSERLEFWSAVPFNGDGMIDHRRSSGTVFVLIAAIALGACGEIAAPWSADESAPDETTAPGADAGAPTGADPVTPPAPTVPDEEPEHPCPHGTHDAGPREEPAADAALPGEQPDDAGAPVVVVEPTVPPPGSVYADVLASGWNLNGWGWHTTATEAASPAHGQRALRVSMDRAWSGFVLARTSGGQPEMFAGGSHDALEFDVYTGSVPDAVATLEVRLNNGNPNVRVRDWAQGTWQADVWMHVSIPFAALNPSNAPYHRVEWFNASESAYSFSIDDVVLTPPVTAPVVVLPASIAIGRTVSTGQHADRLTWLDAKGRPRSADFVDDVYRGGYIRAMRYETAPGVVREAHGGIDPSTGYQGFGYLVSHYDSGYNSGSDSADSRDGDWSATLKNNGRSSVVWQGKHHAIRSYTVDLHPQYYKASGRGTVHATVHWLVASGRSSLTFSVTYDASENPADSIVADSRAPYGALAWDGNGGRAPVSGVAWGDKRRFTTTGSADLSVASDWTYVDGNVVPYNSAWAASTDAEMGLVDTRSFGRSVSGGDLGVWFDAQGRVHGSQRMDTRCWSYTSLTALTCADASDGAGAKIPVTWAWPYQSVNYGLGAGTTNKKIAWGTSYGAVGHRSVVTFGDRTFSGYPYTSYTTQVVLGTHSERAVLGTVSAQEAALQTLVTAQVGSVRTSGAPGVGRSDVAPFETAGFDPVYGAFALLADAEGRSDFTLGSGTQTLSHPLVVVDGAAGAVRSVTLDGAPLQDGVDYYASVQDARVWITLARDLTGSHAVSVRTK